MTCLIIAAGLAAAEGIVAVPVDGYVPRPRLAQCEPTPPARTPVPGSPDALWLNFDRMSPVERQNAVLSLQPSSEALPGAWDESRAICRLWNSRDFDAAIARLRGYYRFDDPCRVTVAISLRTPIETPQDGTWGPDVRIGAYDSIHDLMLDRGANGYLYAAMPCEDSTFTRVTFCRSINNGSSWQATSWIGWGVNNYLSAWSAACHGDYYQVSWTTLDQPQRAWAGRKSMSTGGWINFPGDSLCVPAIEAASGDTIRELAECTQEDVSPGFRIYLFGRTRSRLLYFSWTDSSCRAWRHHSTNVTTCDRGLDCSFNEGTTLRYLWTSWVRMFGTDSAFPAFGYMANSDSVFHSARFTGIPARHNAFEPTSITAWKDTVSIAYTSSTFLARMVYTNTGGDSGWSNRQLSHDTLYTQELPDVDARQVGGLATAYRSYAPGSPRWVFFRHAPRANGTLTAADTVNEATHRPSPSSRIRIVPLGSGSYGVGWINWTDGVEYGAWFNTYTPSGIAELPPAPPAPLSFRAVPRAGGASLAFENPAPGPVRLRVFDRAGRLAWSERLSLPEGRQTAEFHSAAAGAYIAVLEAGGRFVTAKFATVK
jgi:hypothetical protein